MKMPALYGAWVYLPGRVVPDEFWRKLELIYPSGDITTLIYRTEPPQAELMELMWALQGNSCLGYFRLRMTLEDGTVEDVEGL